MLVNNTLYLEVGKHLEKYPDAAMFLMRYGDLCHAVDDLIDWDNPTFKDRRVLVLDCFNLELDVFSCPFYHTNVFWLYPIAKNIHRVYSASVVWEKSDVEWKRQYADVIRCFGNEMIMAMLEHICHLSYEELRRIDTLMREDSWERHHTPEGKPI